jgi:hypothetical protein
VKPEHYAAALAAVGLDSSWDERALKGSTVAWKGQETT